MDLVRDDGSVNALVLANGTDNGPCRHVIIYRLDGAQRESPREGLRRHLRRSRRRRRHPRRCRVPYQTPRGEEDHLLHHQDRP